MKKIIPSSLVQAVCLSVYILFVSFVLTNGERLFNKTAVVGPVVIVPVILLLLFTFSAAVCTILVFGRPVIWYLDGKKKESLYLLGATMAWLFIILVIAVVCMLLINHFALCCGARL